MPKKVLIDELIKKFNTRHNNYYNYSLVNYNKMSDKISIICPKHGVFQQTPTNHLYKGCKKCGIDKNILSFSNSGKSSII